MGSLVFGEESELSTCDFFARALINGEEVPFSASVRSVDILGGSNKRIVYSSDFMTLVNEKSRSLSNLACFTFGQSKS